MRNPIVLGLLSLVLSGCVTLLPSAGPAPQVFRLDPPVAPFDKAATVDWTVSVARPAVSRILSGPDLVLREGANRVAFVAESEWAEPIPGLLQRSLVESLGRSGKIIATTPESGARADCELQWDVYAFDIQDTGEAFAARFEAGAKLVDGRRRTILAATQVSIAAETPGHTARTAAAALSQVAQGGMRDIGSWLLTQTCPKPKKAGTSPELVVAEPAATGKTVTGK